mmetsp:Transcript_15906/g.38356  ORF Transcript_15906/g.38356 Transcript_15906/m.38356 type:complete len:132 (+) Transcript_15906:55-450(+)
MMRTSLAGCLAAALCVAHVSADSSRGLAAFASPALPSLGGLRHARACKANVGLKMGMEQLEFIIHPDGRVEEKVIGIKGGQCHEVTAKIEENLGKVSFTQPTAERFEEEVKVTITDKVQEKVGESGPWSKY